MLFSCEAPEIFSGERKPPNFHQHESEWIAADFLFLGELILEGPRLCITSANDQLNVIK